MSVFLTYSRTSVRPISDDLISLAPTLLPEISVALFSVTRAVILPTGGSFVDFGWSCLRSGERKALVQFSGRSEASLSLQLAFVVLFRVVLKKRRRKLGWWLRSFLNLVLWRISCAAVQSDSLTQSVFLCEYLLFCCFRVVFKFISQTFPMFIMLFRNSFIMGLSLERVGSLLKSSIRMEET